MPAARAEKRLRFFEDGLLSWPALDPILLLLVVVLPLIGVVAVASASMPAVDEDARLFGESTVRQLGLMLLGMLVAFVFSLIDYRRLGRPWWVFYLLTLGLLAVLFVPGMAAPGGPKRWLDLRVLSFQPSELAKPALIVTLSYWAMRLGPKVRARKWFWAGFLVVGATLVLVMAEPDMGTTAIIALTAMAVAIAAGAKFVHLLALIPAGAAMGLISMWFNSYQWARLEVFLGLIKVDPVEAGYHTDQTLLALGSGGVAGRGLGLGTLKYQYLPFPQTDSVFAVVGEEVGLIGTGLLLGLFLLLLWRGLWVAFRAPDTFGRCLAAGMTFQICTQAFVNMAVVAGALPVTGIPLPFISSGGTSLVVSLGMMGILINIARAAQLRGQA